MRQARNGILAAIGITVLAASPVLSQEDSDALERGRALTEAFYAGQLSIVVEAFNAEMREALGAEEGLSAFRSQVSGQLGPEREMLEERVSRSGPHRVYHRSVRFVNAEGAFAVVWAFAEDGSVAGFSIRPEQGAEEPAESRYLEYRTQTPLRLPFDGEWTVVWGGRSIAENYHAAHRDQRFAYDLLVMRDGARHRGSGDANEDYYCFGEPVLAPGPGVVVIARDGLADNTPGQMDATEPPGNHVVLDHGNGEYSFLAHLQRGSVRVEPGDTAAAGDTLGLCGNSGNSSEPHLHYHLQSSPEFGRGEGMPAQFLDFLADGERVKRGEPVKGQRIRPVERPD